MDRIRRVEDGRLILVNAAGLGLFVAAMFALRLGAASALHFDSARELYFAQELRWLYEAGNPPLYAWLLGLVNGAFGTGIATVLGLNHVLLLLALVAYLLLAGRLLGSAHDGALAAWMLLAIPQIFRFFHARSHSFPLVLFAAVAVLVFIRLWRTRRTVDYALLGLVFGAGLVSKYNFAAVIGLLLGAALLRAETRRAVLDRRLGVTAAVLALTVVPVVLAAPGFWENLGAIYQQRTGQITPHLYFDQLIGGAKRFAVVVVDYVYVPLALTAAAVAAAAIGSRGAEAPGAAQAPVAGRLAADYLALGLAVLIAGVVLGGVATLAGHHLHPFLFLLPVAAVAFWRRRAPEGNGRRALIAGLVLALGILSLLRVAGFSPLCARLCHDLVPYDRLIAELRAAGFAGGVVFADDYVVAGNLRVGFPQSRIHVAGTRFQPERRPVPGGGNCLVIWGAARATPPPRLSAAAGLEGVQREYAVATVTTRWRWRFIDLRRPFADRRERVSRWRYILLPLGAGGCG